MTQDAPLDQTAPIDADVLRKLVPGFRLDWSGLRNRFDDIAARLDKLTTYESRAAYLDEIARNFEDAVSAALSRRVPVSGEEAPRTSTWSAQELTDDCPYETGKAGHPSGYSIDPGAGSATDRVQRDWPAPAQIENIRLRGGSVTPLYAIEDANIATSPLAASPIVAGWRRAFLAYVEPEDAFTQLAIALCRADGNNPDATVSIDGGPMQRHWHYYAEEARTMLLAPAPSIPEGVAAPEGWRLVPEYPDDTMMQAGLYQSSHDAEWADVFQSYVDMVRVAPTAPNSPSIPEGKAEPVAWVTPETLADLLNNAPWAAGAIGELSQRKKDNYTAPLFAAPPAPEGKAEPVIWLQFNATDGFTGLRRWTRDKAQAERWMAEDDAHKYRFEAYSARIDLPVRP